MNLSPPGFYYNTVSSMVSRFHVWCRELGYPELDVVEFDDGEWQLIQYLKSPTIPSMTPWQPVLTKLRHVDKCPHVIKKWAEQLDIEKRHVWDAQDATETRMKAEIETEELRLADKGQKAYDAVRKNPDLMERIARNGLGELSLRQISRHIPNHRFRK